MADREALHSWLLRIDRRIIYAAVAVALAAPLVFKLEMQPARMKTAEQFFRAVEGLDVPKNGIVLISMDWGPGTKAENEPQTEMLIKHLMLRRIPFAVMSTYVLSRPFLKGLPEGVAESLADERRDSTGETWTYGRDWVNLGYRPGGGLTVQGMAKSENILEFLKTDAYGKPLSEIECFRNVRTIRDIPAVGEFTGLVGALGTWISFFQVPKHRPMLLHGCTSITIPEAFIFLDSGQLAGLHEGVAGAAYYSRLIDARYAKGGRQSESSAVVAMTSLSVAHLAIILFIVLGNVGVVLARRSARRTRAASETQGA